MKIKNLGPIRDVEINLNKMNVFIGKNGTGKTLGAYALFAFIHWFNHRFVADIVKEDDIKDILHNGNKLMPIDEVKSKIAKQASEQFNSIGFNDFDSFFNHTGVYTKTSRIEMSPEDVNALLRTRKNKTIWYYSWQLRREQVDSFADASEKSEIETKDCNKITCKLNNNFIELSYEPLVDISDDELEDQFNEFCENQNSLRIVSLCIQNNLFEPFQSALPVYLPAERIGINVFRRDLNLTRLNSFPTQGIQSTNEFQQQKNPKKYSFPIEKYISFVNNNVEKLNQVSESIDKNALINEFIPGSFKYDGNEDKLTYALPNSSLSVLDFEGISSSLKSIFGLDLFLKSDPEGKWLFFDEPEMNLHPENQRLIAKLLYEMMKNNIQLVISTHSDYFIKELINCVLKDKVKGESNNEVNVYEFKDGSANNVNNIFNIEEPVENFDDTTRKINDEYYELIDEIDE